MAAHQTAYAYTGQKPQAFLLRFPPSQRRHVRRMFQEALRDALTPTSLLDHVFLTTISVLSAPGYYRNLPAWKRLKDVLEQYPEDAWAYATALLPQGQKRRAIQ